MKHVALSVLWTLLSACSDAPLPSLAPSPSPADLAGPSADLPYRPVMAGTASHGIGARP